MKSFPLIETALSDTEQEFVDFVENHSASLYEADSDRGLPGDTVRARVRIERSGDDVVIEHHTIEFMSLSPEGRWQSTGCIGHAVKEVQALQAGLVQLESRFEVRTPGLGDEEVARTEIEPFVRDQLDRLSAARLLRFGNLSNDMVAGFARP
jgi:hypothetical protein